MYAGNKLCLDWLNGNNGKKSKLGSETESDHEEKTHEKMQDKTWIMLPLYFFTDNGGDYLTLHTYLVLCHAAEIINEIEDSRSDRGQAVVAS